MQQELNLKDITAYIQRLDDDDIRYELYSTLLEQLDSVHLDNVTLKEILKSIKDRKIMLAILWSNYINGVVIIMLVV